MIALTIAVLVFFGLVTLVLGLWWAAETRRRLRSRLETPLPEASARTLDLLRAQPGPAPLGGLSALTARLTALEEQAGYPNRGLDFLLIIAGSGLLGGLLGTVQTGSLLWGLLTAPVAASLPVGYLLVRRHRRLRNFEEQFPDALDMMARAIRAGNAMGLALQLVGEEMPEPSGGEFSRVAEEVRLGMDLSEALARLGQRMPTEDFRFFATAVRIQRGSGGNLAELLDRLSELIRERFKVLSHARALSAQHRWSAIIVGVFPFFFAIILQLLQPGYFEPLLKDPLGPYLIGAGLLLEAVGFFWIWRVAQIKV
jgi:tight adherence protein B